MLNKFLHTKGIHIKILNTISINITSNLKQYCLPNINYDKISTMNDISQYIDLCKQNDIIYIGNVVSLCNSNIDLYDTIMSNLTFCKHFHDMKDIIKKQLNLTSFNCVHLRIEDDAINYFSTCYNLTVGEYNDRLLSFYNKRFEPIRTYVCSGMLRFDNSINGKYYNSLMKNKTICDKSNIIIDEHYLSNRELIAIIDLLIAYDSDNFIGCHISSFSRVIQQFFKCKKNKECELFII